MMKRMTTKTFMTKDDRGCEFRVKAYYGSLIGWSEDGQTPIYDRDYYSMDIHTKSLQELKTKVANLP